MIEGVRVVTAEEMQRIEQLAFASGESDLAYMEKAGEGVAGAIARVLLTPRTTGTIHLLVGKGNNGGDAFVAGTHLVKKGFTVTASLLYPLEECSPLSQTMGKRYALAGGRLHKIDRAPLFDPHEVIIDGLVGTGFHGAAKGLLAEVIEAANQSGRPIFAIDIPSGLNGNTGEVETVAIRAQTTFYLGLPKIGFFLKKGWDHVGKLVPIDFGMPPKFVELANPTAYLIDRAHAGKELPPIVRTRHKYQAGYVLAIAGSSGMSGAALLCSYATLKTGAGIVRLFYPHEMKDELCAAPLELIKEGWDLIDDHRIIEESKRAKALIVGPGMGRSEKTERAIHSLLRKTTLPTVIDADGLFFLAKNPSVPLPAKTVLTPHAQEMERLLHSSPTLERCQGFVNDKKVTLVLKGAPTMVFHPLTKPLIIPQGDPGMATAGTGDVLTGVIASLLAQGLEPRKAAALGALLHALAGELAAQRKSSYGMTATDLLHSLPDALLSLISVNGVNGNVK